MNIERYQQGYYIENPLSSDETHSDSSDLGPERVGRHWLLHDLNFENVLNATLTLFVISTGEGWPGVYDVAKSATEKNKGKYFICL